MEAGDGAVVDSNCTVLDLNGTVIRSTDGAVVDGNCTTTGQNGRDILRSDDAVINGDISFGVDERPRSAGIEIAAVHNKGASGGDMNHMTAGLIDGSVVQFHVTRDVQHRILFGAGRVA